MQSPRDNEWERDGGLLCQTLQSLGMDSRLVSLGQPFVQEGNRRIVASLEQMEDSDWWRQWNLLGVILYSWAAPRYEGVARAISRAGLKCIVKIDSDGYKSPRQGWVRFCWSYYTICRDSRRRWPALQAVSKTILFSLFPAIYDLPMLRHLAFADVIGIESPMARELLCDLLRRCGRDDLAGKVRTNPHPVTMDMRYVSSVSKERLVLGVARWDGWAKDTPRFVNALIRFLLTETEFKAELIGTGADILIRLLDLVPAGIHERIKVVGPVEHEKLQSYYQRAQIILFTSRGESGPIAAEEALCCGCSVVGPASLPSLHWFCGEDCGTLANGRSVPSLTSALRKEAQAWRDGKRNPQRISALWIPRVHASFVVNAILQLAGRGCLPSHSSDDAFNPEN